MSQTSVLRPAPLTGFLYFLSHISALTIAAIGLTFILFGTRAATLGFGIPITNPTLALASNSSSSATSDAYIAIIGVRDLTLAFVGSCFAFLRDRRGVGMVLAGGLFATVGDGLVMAAYSKDPVWWIGAHVLTGVPMMVLCAVLLMGGDGVGKVKR